MSTNSGMGQITETTSDPVEQLPLFEKNERDETIIPCPACRSWQISENLILHLECAVGSAAILFAYTGAHLTEVTVIRWRRSLSSKRLDAKPTKFLKRTLGSGSLT